MPCWFYEKKDLRTTPSLKDGISTEVESRYRREGARFIIDSGTKMGLRYDTCATGVVYFHRFYMFHSFRHFHRYVTAACCLFLAGKVEETPKKCKDIMKITRSILTESQFAVFGDDPREELMTMERILLQTIKFDLMVEHPYAFVLKYAKQLKGDKNKIQNLVQTTWTFVNDSLCTNLCLQWEPDIIAVSLMYLSSRLTKVELSDWEGKVIGNKAKWYDFMVPDVTLDIMEDVCHQVLDLYSKMKQASNKEGSPPPPPPPPKPAATNASGATPKKRSRSPSPGSKAKRAATTSSSRHSSPGASKQPPAPSPVKPDIKLNPYTATTAAAAAAGDRASGGKQHAMANTATTGAPVPPGGPAGGGGGSGGQSYSGSSNPYMSSQMFSSSFMSGEGSSAIQTLIKGGSSAGQRHQATAAYHHKAPAKGAHAPHGAKHTGATAQIGKHGVSGAADGSAAYPPSHYNAPASAAGYASTSSGSAAAYTSQQYQAQHSRAVGSGNYDAQQYSQQYSQQYAQYQQQYSGTGQYPSGSSAQYMTSGSQYPPAASQQQQYGGGSQQSNAPFSSYAGDRPAHAQQQQRQHHQTQPSSSSAHHAAGAYSQHGSAAQSPYSQQPSAGGGGGGGGPYSHSHGSSAGGAQGSAYGHHAAGGGPQHGGGYSQQQAGYGHHYQHHSGGAGRGKAPGPMPGGGGSSNKLPRHHRR